MVSPPLESGCGTPTSVCAAWSTRFLGGMTEKDARAGPGKGNASFFLWEENRIDKNLKGTEMT